MACRTASPFRTAPDKYDCLLVTGPTARDVLSRISDADLTLGWLSFQTARVAGADCVMLRVSFAGELGWEVHCSPDDAPAIWDALMDANVTPFGMFALDTMRIEKGYKAWKGDLSSDYSLLELGLDRFADFGKPEFRGRSAMLAERQAGVKKVFTILTLDTAPEADAPHMAAIWQGGEIVGEVTSGSWGYRVRASVALGMVRPDLAVPGTQVTIEIFGAQVPATVRGADPLWDPKNLRLRA